MLLIKATPYADTVKMKTVGDQIRVTATTRTPEGLTAIVQRVYRQAKIMQSMFLHFGTPDRII